MSASKEKKIRKEQRNATDWIDPKSVREEQDRKNLKRSNIIFAVVAALFVVVGIVSITWNSGIMQKGSDAITINGETYSPAQVQYYYVNTYQNFINDNYYYLAYYGLNTAASLKAQDCFLLEDGTWHDYFVTESAQNMADIHALCSKAEAAGLTWNDDMQASYEAELARLEANRTSYNESYSTKLDTDAYLQLVFGDLMTEEIYQQETKLSVQAQEYCGQYLASLEYSDADIEAAYEADKDTYDRVSYSYLRISGAAATTDADGKTITPSAEDKAAAMADAKALAQELLQKAEKGETFEDLSREYAKASLTNNEGGVYADNVYMKWLFDESRKEGELAWLEDTENSCYYVIRFNNRFRYDYNTVNVRHILVELGTGSMTSEDAGYELQQEFLKDTALSEAETILSDWRLRDATEESFAALAVEHSDDAGSSANGGLYEQVYRGQMVTEFNDWCFDETRKPGDTDIIYSESTGYHIMYFVGEDEPYWKVQVSDALLNSDYSDWYALQVEGCEYEIHDFGMSAVG